MYLFNALLVRGMVTEDGVGTVARRCHALPKCKELTGSKSKIVRMPLPADDPKQRRPDITKAQELLGWQPTTPLREGLVKTIAYFDELLKTDPEFCAG